MRVLYRSACENSPQIFRLRVFFGVIPKTRCNHGLHAGACGESPGRPTARHGPSPVPRRAGWRLASRVSRAIRGCQAGPSGETPGCKANLRPRCGFGRPGGLPRFRALRVSAHLPARWQMEASSGRRNTETAPAATRMEAVDCCMAPALTATFVTATLSGNAVVQ